MAQTALAVTILKQNNYAVQAGDLTVSFASDIVNGNSFAATGREIILAYNSDTVAHTFTVTSQPDSLGRTADIAAYSVAAGAVAAIEASVLNGWINSSGNVILTSTNALLKFGILRFV
jgi:hypothetical protein